MAGIACSALEANAATYTVTTTADSGAGSFRQAILDANATVGVTDTIEFNIPVDDPGHVYYFEDGQTALGQVTQTTEADDANLDSPDLLYPRSWFRISALSPIPAIVDPVIIDGYSQPGASMTTGEVDDPIDAILKIEIYGDAAGSSILGLWFDAGSDGSTLRGLAIKQFRGSDPAPSHGLFLSSNNNKIEGNFIGPGVDGISGSLNTHGIGIAGSGNVIGGLTPESRNLVSGNNRRGFSIYTGASGNFIRRNFIGVNRSGAGALPNFREGVAVFDSADNVIGGGNPIARNIISGNSYHGILFMGPLCTGNF
ncbi:MAG: hypothetical protein KC994_26170, partial [Candidatus Omnitrophica bacterium]|nr:hypothetical protein [Candidatus Omnitrophota bacterium]